MAIKQIKSGSLKGKKIKLEGESMYQTLSKGDFRDAFVAMNRKDNFSYEGLGALYDHLEEVYDGKYELDVIGLCGEFNEDEIETVLKDYELKSLDELNENTIVVWNDGTNVLYQAYGFWRE